MFGNKQKATIRELEQENRQLRRENESLKSSIEQLSSPSFDSPVALDFKSMKAFSIERLPDGNVNKTVIGYLVTNGQKEVVHEWYLHCSDRIHNDLVEKFNNYIASK